MFLGNGLIAIVAGLLGHGLVETFDLGPVAPFDAAAVTLLVGGAIIMATWSENFGDPSDKVCALTAAKHTTALLAFSQSRPAAWKVLQADRSCSDQQSTWSL